jgi:hypothetical protein
MFYPDFRESMVYQRHVQLRVDQSHIHPDSTYLAHFGAIQPHSNQAKYLIVSELTRLTRLTRLIKYLEMHYQHWIKCACFRVYHVHGSYSCMHLHVEHHYNHHDYDHLHLLHHHHHHPRHHHCYHYYDIDQFCLLQFSFSSSFPCAIACFSLPQPLRQLLLRYPLLQVLLRPFRVSRALFQWPVSSWQTHATFVFEILMTFPQVVF